MKKKFFLFITIYISIPCFAQTWQDTSNNIEKIFSRYKLQNPGCQLSVSRNGSIIFSKAWGMSDLENNIPLSSNSIIEAGSVSKQFTAAAILLLEQQRKLSLNDDVRKYIPELPDYGTVIKLKHMMHHTSGIKDWGSIAQITGWERGTKIYSNKDALEMIAQQKTLNNKPGDEFIYSNSNYNLFAIIVKRVSGISLAEFTQKYIFIPAGMKHTQCRDNFRRIVKNGAIAYQKTDTAYESDMPNEDAYGNGGLLTTTEDLLKWNTYYLSGKLGNDTLISAMLK
jgi:CubicO group peptidase (beta-lactamase class C family)